MPRRRGVFERLPRRLYRQTGARYFDALGLSGVLNGITVAGFGVLALVLYVDLPAGDLALFAAASAAGYVVEGAAAWSIGRRVTRPARRWLAGDDADETAAWAAAARLPVTLVRHPLLLALGLLGAAASSLVLAALLDLPTEEAALAFPAAALLYVSSVILRFVAFDLAARPLLERLGEPAETPPRARVTLHQRLFVTVPMVTWGTALLCMGLLTDDRADLDTLGLASVVAVGVTTVVSVWLGLVLADTVSAPIRDLRDATRRVGAGDLDVRVPVISTDETGELAASFNAMVAGLEERERLRDAFGTFVDPAVAQRVLAEGPDLHGEEVEATILFLDVRGFTEFAERAAPQEVVAGLEELYEAVVPVIERHGGHANKFVGDGLLAVFGTPQRHQDHARRAVAAAREICRRGTGRLRVGIGINTGPVIVGTISGGGRRDFTVVGDAVNTAARVEAMTRETDADVLITAATRALLGEEARAWVERPAIPLKGKSEPVRLFAPGP